MTGLAQYRKFISLLVTGLVVFTMAKLGLDAKELAEFGIDVNEWQAFIVEFLALYAVPGVIGVLAQPNGLGQKLLQYWRWVAGGLGVVSVIIAIVLVF